MRDDPILTLESELVAAARRAVAPARRAVTPARRRAGAGIAVSVAAAGIAVAVAVGALLLLGGQSRPIHSTAATPAPRQLVEMLGVLRRPQTAADRALAMLTAARWPALAGTPDRTLIRFAGVTPWGTKVFLVPVTPLSGRQLDRFHQPLLGFLRRRAAAGESIIVLAGVPQVASGATAAEIEAGRATVIGRGTGRRGSLRLVTVVPDGVASVGLEFAARSIRRGNLIETVAVQHNVAALEVYSRPTVRMALVWFARDGRVLRWVALRSVALRHR